MNWRDLKMREVSEHLDKAYYGIREIRNAGIRKGSDAGKTELMDAMDLLNLSERMAKRGSKMQYIWEARNRADGGRNA